VWQSPRMLNRGVRLFQFYSLILSYKIQQLPIKDNPVLHVDSSHKHLCFDLNEEERKHFSWGTRCQPNIISNDGSHVIQQWVYKEV